MIAFRFNAEKRYAPPVVDAPPRPAEEAEAEPFFNLERVVP
jgi:hypothetical protein